MMKIRIITAAAANAHERRVDPFSINFCVNY